MNNLVSFWYKAYSYIDREDPFRTTSRQLINSSEQSSYVSVQPFICGILHTLTDRIHSRPCSVCLASTCTVVRNKLISGVTGVGCHTTKCCHTNRNVSIRSRVAWLETVNSCGGNVHSKQNTIAEIPVLCCCFFCTAILLIYICYPRWSPVI